MDAAEQTPTVQRREVAYVASAAVGALVAAAAVAVLVGRSSVTTELELEAALQPGFQLLLAVGWAVPGLVLAMRRGDLSLWVFTLLAAASHALAAILVAVAPDVEWCVWVASWLVVVELPLLAVIVQLFPTGRPLAGWRWYLLLSVVVGLVGIVAVAVEATPGVSQSVADVAGAVSVPLLAFCAVGAVVPLVVRFRRTTGGERRAVAWLLVVMAAGVVVPGMVAAGGQSGEIAAQLFTVAQLLFMSIAVLRHRVWGLTPMAQRSLQRVVTATDAERQRIRAELHDGVGAGLTAVRLKVDAAARMVDRRPERAGEMLVSASSDIGSVLDEVRRLIDGLRPAVLDRLDLAAALRLSADELSLVSPSLSIRVLDAEHLALLPLGADVAVYRLVTEAMNNVVRHADATVCEVRVSARQDEVVIDVGDDGTDPIVEREEGLGLSSMAARAAEVGGYLVTGAGPERGFLVHAVIPRSTT